MIAHGQSKDCSNGALWHEADVPAASEFYPAAIKAGALLANAPSTGANIQQTRQAKQQIKC
jgi:hypothetical protein